MAKINDIISSAKETLFSFEILPPLKGEDIHSLFGAIENLMEFKPPFIDVTYHREDYVYKKRENGLMEKVAVYKRPGTVAISAAIMQRFNVEAVPHLLCGSFNREETENALLELDFLGIENVLALRGDPIKSEGVFKPEKDGNAFASDLVKQIKNLNNGIYLDEDDTNLKKTNFCIGVAGYPEKHFEAPNLSTDLRYLKEKVDNGADYIVTQMFFDNQKFFEFVKLCKDNGINVPIIPGLKPLTTKKQLTILPSIFHLDIPEALSNEVLKAKDAESVKRIGIDWCIEQSKELKKAGVPVLHYYTMSKSDAIKEIASKVF
ncbi:MAG: methylenetetrahydrofolate reductase [NAD(P)H] [Cytophagales bacterium]